jgi:hypothetical protein
MKKSLIVALAGLAFLVITVGRMQEARAAAASVDGLWVLEQDFTNWVSMTIQDIRDFLAHPTRNSFMKAPFIDADGTSTDAAQEIYNAAVANAINPQVLLATLQKENRAVTRQQTPSNSVLKCLAGWGACSPTAKDQIHQMAAQLRRDFDRVARCETTLGGWTNDSPHDTGENKIINGKSVWIPELDFNGLPMSATPENKAVSSDCQRCGRGTRKTKPVHNITIKRVTSMHLFAAGSFSSAVKSWQPIAETQLR